MKWVRFIAGVIVGGLLFGSIFAVAGNLSVTPSSQDIYVDNVKVNMTAYNIGDNNYVKLRDIGKAVNFGVDYDSSTDSVYIDSAKPYVEEGSTAPSPTVSPQLPSPLPKETVLSLSDAYFQIFLNISKVNLAARDVKYIVVDLSKVKMQPTEYLVEKFQDFCISKNYTLLQDNLDGLKEKGYITNKYGGDFFEDGILITFNDEELTDTFLKTHVNLYYGALYGEGAVYTAQKDKDKWILKVLSRYIS